MNLLADGGDDGRDMLSALSRNLSQVEVASCYRFLVLQREFEVGVEGEARRPTVARVVIGADLSHLTRVVVAAHLFP